MKIVNVLEILNGIPSQIESFPIYEEQLSQDVVDAAEKFYLECCYGKDYLKKIDTGEYEDIDDMLGDCTFDDDNGHEVYIIWSN